jgi:ABC-type transporter Mla subunit MlaD
MSMVIHGMSTALSTTTSAIVCYLIFGYLYLKLTDVLTQLLSGIEQATSLYILPRYTYQADSMLHEVGSLVKALRSAADSMAQTQMDYAEMGRNLNEITAGYGDRMAQLNADMKQIKQLLKQGFRLPE